MVFPLRIIFFIGALLSTPVLHAEMPLFDTHLHYSSADAALLTSADVIHILDRNKVSHAVITGTPPEHTMTLYRHAPERIVPFLGVYRSLADKSRWHQDQSLPTRIKRQLDTDPWAGIGELHIFAEHRTSPVFLSIVQLATRRGLPLLLHADPAVIDTLFSHTPKARVIWAHAGAYPYPPLLGDYLRRYPNLYIDLSVRNDLVAPDGKLDAEWEELLLEYSGRFMVGVDTYSTSRWSEFDAVTRQTRDWLKQLPSEVASSLRHRNAEHFFQR